MTWNAHYNGKDTIIESEEITLVYKGSDVSQLSKEEVLSLANDDSEKWLDNGYSVSIVNKKHGLGHSFNISSTPGLSIQQLYAERELEQLLQQDNPSLEDIRKLFSITGEFSRTIGALFLKKFGIKEAFENNNFTKINLYGLNIDDKKLFNIIDYLSNHSNLKSIVLAKNALTSESGEAIVSLLKTHPHLAYLRICHNKLSDEGVRKITQELNTNTTLKGLQIYNNNITSEGFSNIAELISKNSSINSISFATESEKIGTEELDILHHALESNHTLLDNDLDSQEACNTDNKRYSQVSEIAKVMINLSNSNDSIDIKHSRMYQTIDKGTIVERILAQISEPYKWITESDTSVLYSEFDFATFYNDKARKGKEAIAVKNIISKFDDCINSNFALREVCKGGIMEVFAPLPLEIILHIMQYDERSLWHSDICKSLIDESYAIEAIGDMSETSQELHI